MKEVFFVTSRVGPRYSPIQVALNEEHQKIQWLMCKKVCIDEGDDDHVKAGDDERMVGYWNLMMIMMRLVT